MSAAKSLLAKTLILLLSWHFIAVKSAEYYKEKPDFIQTCRINAEDFTKCSTNAVQKLFEALIKGIPEITAEFGPIDPMHVRDILFKPDSSQVAAMTANITKVVVKGFSQMVAKESKISKKDFSWRTKIFVPKMRIDANYEMNGRMLLMPILGKGKLLNEIDNLDITLYTKVRLHEKDTFTFYNVTNVSANLNMTKMRFYFGGLFNGVSKELEQSTNQFFNENWRDVYEAFKPIIVDTVSDVFYNIMHKLFQVMPANFFIEDLPTSQQLYGNKTKSEH